MWRRPPRVGEVGHREGVAAGLPLPHARARRPLRHRFRLPGRSSMLREILLARSRLHLRAVKGPME